MSHRNAPLTPQRRLLLCRRIEAGATIAQVAEAMGLSRHCASKWWRRYVELGVAACMTAPAVLAAAHPPAREPRSQDLPPATCGQGRPRPPGRPLEVVGAKDVVALVGTGPGGVDGGQELRHFKHGVSDQGVVQPDGAS